MIDSVISASQPYDDPVMASTVGGGGVGAISPATANGAAARTGAGVGGRRDGGRAVVLMHADHVRGIDAFERFVCVFVCLCVCLCMFVCLDVDF